MCQSELRFADWVRLSTLGGTAGTRECLHPDGPASDNLIVKGLMEADMSRTEIAPELLEFVAGGAIGFDPDAAGTYTMRCQFSGDIYPGVCLANVMAMAQFGASVPNTPEGEQQIIAWAKARNYI